MEMSSETTWSNPLFYTKKKNWSPEREKIVIKVTELVVNQLRIDSRHADSQTKDLCTTYSPKFRRNRNSSAELNVLLSNKALL